MLINRPYGRASRHIGPLYLSVLSSQVASKRSMKKQRTGASNEKSCYSMRCMKQNSMAMHAHGMLQKAFVEIMSAQAMAVTPRRPCALRCSCRRCTV